MNQLLIPVTRHLARHLCTTSPIDKSQVCLALIVRRKPALEFCSCDYLAQRAADVVLTEWAAGAGAVVN